MAASITPSPSVCSSPGRGLAAPGVACGMRRHVPWCRMPDVRHPGGVNLR